MAGCLPQKRQLGDVVGGKYEIESFLVAGGMGAVYTHAGPLRSHDF